MSAGSGGATQLWGDQVSRYPGDQVALSCGDQVAATYLAAGVPIPPYVRTGPSLTRNYTNKPHKKELFTSLWQNAVTIEQST